MLKEREKITKLVKLSLFAAIIVVLSMTPLGYIPLGVIKATTIHIPVILGSIMLGWKYGAVLGGLFGLTSLVVNTVTPNLTSFVFTPFYSVGELHGSFLSLPVCFVPRILTGIVPYFVFKLVNKLFKSEGAALTAAGFLGSMTNTIFVMHFIYIFFGNQWASAKGIAEDVVYTTILAVIATNGIPEAVAAAVLTAVAGAALFKITRGKGTHKNKPRKEDF